MPLTRHSKICSAQWPLEHNRLQVFMKSTKSRPNHRKRTIKPKALSTKTRFHLFSLQSLANHNLSAASLELEATTIPLTLHSRPTTCSRQEWLQLPPKECSRHQLMVFLFMLNRARRVKNRRSLQVNSWKWLNQSTTNKTTPIWKLPLLHWFSNKRHLIHSAIKALPHLNILEWPPNKVQHPNNRPQLLISIISQLIAPTSTRAHPENQAKTLSKHQTTNEV